MARLIVAEVCRRLIDMTVVRLPEQDRDRFREEWQAHLGELESSLDKVVHVFGCALSLVPLNRINRHIDRVVSAKIDEVFGKVSAEIAALANQRSEYFDGVREAIISLPSRGELDKIFNKYRYPLPQPSKANADAREALYFEIQEAMYDRGAAIASRLFDLMSRLKETVLQFGWGDVELIEWLMGDEKDYKACLNSAITALIMRYARPVSEAYIYSSKETISRLQLLELWRHDLKTIELFMNGNFDGRVAVGVVAVQPPKPDVRATHEVDEKNVNHDVFFAMAEAEIIEDLSTVQKMLEAVYFASGVQQYCDQELRRMLRGIISNDNRHFWRAARLEAFRGANPDLIASLASEIGSAGEGRGQHELYNKLKRAVGLNARGRQ